MLPDLRNACPDLDRMFDAVVAENGGLLYLPARREVRTLGDPPEAALVEALRLRGVSFDLGSSIVATDEPYAEAALAAIRETGVERTRSEEHTSELQSRLHLVCRLLLEKKTAQYISLCPRTSQVVDPN